MRKHPTCYPNDTKPTFLYFPICLFSSHNFPTQTDQKKPHTKHQKPSIPLDGQSFTSIVPSAPLSRLSVVGITMSHLESYTQLLSSTTVFKPCWRARNGQKGEDFVAADGLPKLGAAWPECCCCARSLLPSCANRLCVGLCVCTFGYAGACVRVCV